MLRDQASLLEISGRYICSLAADGLEPVDVITSASGACGFEHFNADGKGGVKSQRPFHRAYAAGLIALDRALRRRLPSSPATSRPYGSPTEPIPPRPPTRTIAPSRIFASGATGGERPLFLMKPFPRSNSHIVGSGKYDSSGSPQSIDLRAQPQSATLRRYPSLIRGVIGLPRWNSWHAHCLASPAVHHAEPMHGSMSN